MSVANSTLLPDIALSWMKFVTTNEIDVQTVCPEILESWQRCQEMGVNPYNGKCNRMLESAELDEMLEKQKDLIEVARPFMANLYDFVRGSGFIVILTDQRGYVMDTFGDQDTLEDAKGLNFIKGASWTEDEVGTNAIGTALVLKRPLQVSGPEHFCRKHHVWTCSATPIFDQNGEVIGTIDLSGPSNGAHRHTLGMVVAAEIAIRNQMRIQQKNRELTLAHNHLAKIIQTMSDGVLTFNDLGIITKINRSTEKIIGKKDQDLAGNSIRDILGERVDQLIKKMLTNQEPFADVEVMVATVDGLIHCVVSGQPILDDYGFLNGGLMLIRPMERVQKMVNLFSGAQAAFHFKDIIGNSPEMMETIRVASLAANKMSSILLQGESGTGKELFAQAVHNRSPRRNGPFVAVNCGAIPRELIASELFGYEGGAFTGAKRGGRPGKFELASGGTLFLDEFGDMPLEQQVSLLRVLQDRKITRIGGDKVIPVDVRVICATNKNLLNEIEKGNFRRDLYYRVNVIPITIPPLRNHPEDISVLFKHFLDKINKEWGTEIEYVDPEVVDYLKRYPWPGNVRELQNVVERTVSITVDNRITLENLPAEILGSRQSKTPEPSSLSQVIKITEERENRKKLMAKEEFQEIADLLERYGGNVSKVAKELGFSRNTLYRKMKIYKIEC